ncbi:hypothetical protein [uncultured Pontibacter sp.]|uniref:hypothetical protein n=1 Tax=uncultured Pontibacter sp. TaxID=453356 RepID=UPI002610ABFB|nr:hypothetical protein [uncultured Pontibacter sp.]
MANFSKAGNWYVDSYFGNDMSGNGTDKNPFATLNRAYISASTGQRIICRGYFAEGLPSSSKGINWEAEGLAVCDGSSLPDGTTCFNSANTNSVRGFKLLFWQGTSYVVFNQNATVLLDECELHYCYLNSATGTSSGLPRFSIQKCIMNECRFSNTSSSNYAGILTGNTFSNCSGSFGNAGGGFIVRNNIFINCNSLSIALPASRPGGMEFNYNNIYGGFSGNSNAQWKLFGEGHYQVNGYQVAPGDIFNDYSGGRDGISYWENDFTMKPDCILRDAANDGLELGAKRIGYRFSAESLWDTFRESSSNLSYSVARGLMLLDLERGQGSYESTWINIGTAIEFDMVNLCASFVVTNGNAKQFIGSRSEAPNSTKNQRKAFDFQLAIADSDQGIPEWKTQEFFRRVRLDAEGRGVADDSFSPASVQIPKGAYFKIAFKMNNLAITA